MRDAAFLLLWLCTLPIIVQGGAWLAVLLWAWTSLLAPNDVLYSFAAGVPFSKLAAVVTLPLVLLGRGGGIRFRLNLATGLLLALMVSTFISQATAASANTAFGWDLYSKYVKILFLAILVIGIMRDRMRVHALLVVICLGIGFTGVAEGLKFLLSGGAHQVQGTPSTGDNNQIGLDVLLILPMLMHLYTVLRQRLVRLACLGAGLICVLCVIASASRGAFLGLVLLALASVVSGKRKIMGVVVVLLLGLAGAQLAPESWFQRMHTIDQAQDDDSFLGRVTAWKVSTVLALNRPAFGGGFHAIQLEDVWDRYRGGIGMFSFIESVPPEHPRAAHSIYFEILGDTGFIGLGLFISLFVLALRNGRVVKRQVRRSGRPDLAWAADLATRLQISITIFMVSGAALSAAYYDIDYLMVALMVVLRDIVDRAIQERGPELAEADRPAAFIAPAGRPRAIAAPSPAPQPAGAAARSSALPPLSPP